MDLLLDINVAVDICCKRHPFFKDADLAVSQCLYRGGRLWLYAGSVQTLEYVTRSELRRSQASPGISNTARQLEQQTRDLLKAFVADKHWLASLAGEGDVFDSPNPEDEQLIRALDRFAPGSIKLLTRDAELCERYPSLTVTPQQYLHTPQQPKAIDFIDLKTQQDCIRPALESNIHRVLQHGQYIMGPEINQLEVRLAEYVGVKHCVTVSDGTNALLIAMMALGIRPGDEVITTPFTFIATGEMIALLGAIPVFVDIDLRTYNIDPSKIEAAITPQTKAIMPVSLYGQCADFDAINAIATKHRLPVIEDGAQSFGAIHRGRKSCGLSTIGSASFFPSKPLGCYGDGGALFTDDDTLAKSIREIRLHGQDRHYHHPRIGINGRMDTIQAAVLQAKMDIFPNEIEARRRIGSQYDKLLGGALVTPYIEPFNTSVYAQYTLLVDDRAAVQESLKKLGLPTAVHYPIPLNIQPVFEYLKKPEGSYPISEEIAKRVMSLPMSPYLTDAAINDIAKAVLDHL
jgi:UDP-2-acetamido-2-deoxy-ribo-hexuluronate aminotransferase